MAELPLQLLSPRAAVIPGPRSWSSCSSSRPSLRRSVLCPCSRRGGDAWGSNAETFPKGKFRFSDFGGSNRGMDEGFEEGERKRKWWFEDEEDDFLDDEIDQPWDSIWIFKMFRAYGYLLPAIIASLLIASGPKAFLMALALPLAQSALSFVLDKLNVTSSSAREAPRRRRNSPPPPPQRNAGRTAEFRRRPKEESRTRRRSEDSTARPGGEFGGWDYASRAPRSAVPPASSMSVGKLSRRERGGEVPLFLRLIISVFPFLGSWMRIL